MMQKLLRRFRNLRRTARNAVFDLRYGGFVGGYRPNPSPGANGTGATDYALMPQIFDGRIRPDDVLVDVGCGYGRVINWWLDQGYRNQIIGLEMMPDVAEHARRRLRRHANVTIVTGDATAALPANGTLFFLFNPFEFENLFESFLDRVLGVSQHSRRVQVIYFAPVLAHVAQNDPRWVVEERVVELPAAGNFEERHRRLAIITPAIAAKTKTALLEAERT
jgi:SAM-dependent methyltransferase